MNIVILLFKGLGSSGDGTVIGDSSLFEDDADNLKALAQKFEEKYVMFYFQFLIAF